MIEVWKYYDPQVRRIWTGQPPMRICSRPWERSRACGSCGRCWQRIRREWWWGEIQNELDIAASTLSHHLEKLKNEDLIKVRRESTFLRYSANTAVLEQLLGFL